MILKSGCVETSHSGSGCLQECEVVNYPGLLFDTKLQNSRHHRKCRHFVKHLRIHDFWVNPNLFISEVVHHVFNMCIVTEV